MPDHPDRSVNQLALRDALALSDRAYQAILRRGDGGEHVFGYAAETEAVIQLADRALRRLFATKVRDGWVELVFRARGEKMLGQPFPLPIKEVLIPASLLPPSELPPAGEGAVAKGERALSLERLEATRPQRCQDLLLAYLRQHNCQLVPEEELRSLATAFHQWEVTDALKVLRKHNLVDFHGLNWRSLPR